jgi:hypothetical protein
VVIVKHATRLGSRCCRSAGSLSAWDRHIAPIHSSAGYDDRHQSLRTSTAISFGEGNDFIGVVGLDLAGCVEHVGAGELQQRRRYIPLPIILGMHRHRLLVSPDDDATDRNTARTLERHAASDPDILQGCRGSLVMQKLQTLNDARVEFGESCLVQAIDIDLPHALCPTHQLIVTANMPIARQYATGRRPIFAHSHRICPAPMDQKRVVALNLTTSYTTETNTIFSRMEANWHFASVTSRTHQRNIGPHNQCLSQVLDRCLTESGHT